MQKCGFIQIEVKRNENKEVIARYIYIIDVPSHQKNQYPYHQKNQESIDENVKENTININIDEDDLFILRKKTEEKKEKLSFETF